LRPEGGHGRADASFSAWTSADQRRHAWHGVIAAGWFTTGIAMAIFVTRQDIYILLAGIHGAAGLPHAAPRKNDGLRDGCR
jgi:hypothetical protein